MVEVQAEAAQDLSLEVAAPPAENNEVAFVLSYDFEITCLVNEGVLRPGMVPSGLKRD
jgi:hypothetical protein